MIQTQTNLSPAPAGSVAKAEKTCTKCGQPKPADKEHFYGSIKTKDGLTHWCKKCHIKSSKKNKQPAASKRTNPVLKIPNTNPAVLKTADPTPPAQAPASQPETIMLPPGRIIETEYNNVLCIDFAGHELLFKTLVDYAEKEFRTPENQILYWLSTHELHEKIIL